VGGRCDRLRRAASGNRVEAEQPVAGTREAAGLCRTIAGVDRTGTGAATTSAGSGPATRPYMESVVARPWISIESSLLSRQEVARNSAEPSGMSGGVIGHSMPGSVLRASTAARNDSWRAAFPSAGGPPPPISVA
jgi:hypothetical protein